ncbi:MAG: cyclic nucleotide-binding domain-containing protein [Chitinivibrionales bacterium]|nr:cyclic nucleotide-binding domain-containing protein [Chitinivibrionales bacterium]
MDRIDKSFCGIDQLVVNFISVEENMAEQQADQVLTRFKRGDCFFRQHDVSNELYIIKSGRVKIFKTEGDIEVELATVGVGEVVGEVAAIDGGPRSASVVALDETEAYVVRKESFRSTFGSIPEWFKKITMILVQRLREVDEKIDNSVGCDKLPHVAALLAMMASAPACECNDGNLEIALTFAQNEILDILNLQIGDTLEILSRLEKMHLIHVSRGKIRIIKPSALEKKGKDIFQDTEEAPVT